MAKTFYFYDLETSGISPHSSRIMQFGGQRTDIDLKPIGAPDNLLIKLTPDILPEPDADFDYWHYVRKLLCRWIKRS